MSSLHPRQERLLELLKENINNPLTIKDLSIELGVSSPGVLYHHLAQLEKKGLLKRNPNNPKDYSLPESPEKAIVYVKEYGLAQCGPGGLLLDDNHINIIPLPSMLIRFPASEAFIVKAKGDSMEPKIYSGDLVIARRQTYAADGELIVCMYNEEARIKKYYNKNGVVAMESLHKYGLEIVREQDQFLIEGVVRNIISYK